MADKHPEKKPPEKPISPEIGKLTEKLAADPKSRLFVPLAEEYLKSGMLDEALMVLTDGLKIHPNFHAAQAMMGKVHLEKGEIAEAKAVFELVIKADPENLLAHRKLVKLYKDAGQREQARSSCQKVLMSNPKDPEMKLVLEELNRIDQAERKKMQDLSSVSMDAGPEEMLVEQTSLGPSEAETRATEPKATEVPNEPYSPTDAPSVIEMTPAELPSPESAAGEALEPPPVPERSLEERASQPAVSEGASPPVEAALMPQSEPSPDDEPPPAPPTEEIITEALANLYIKQGHYDKGIAIYRRLLAKDPGNPILFRKLEETVEQAKQLSEGPRLKSGTPAADRPAAPSPSPGPVNREQQKAQKIQRLQLWLDSIKKGQAR